MNKLGPCRKCRYWFGPPTEFGQCRRHSPPLSPYGTQWPAVHNGDWCGDFEFASLSVTIDRTAQLENRNK